MKYLVECRVDSRILISKEIMIKNEGKIYTFIPDTQGMMKAIRIVVPVSDPELFYSEVILSANDKSIADKTIIKRDQKLLNSLIQEFQGLESNLSFSGGLRRIYWNEPKDDLIFDNKHERQNAKIFGTHFVKSYPKKTYKTNENDLKRMIEIKDRYSSLVIFKSFYREGKNEFTEFRYINAFFNFYFVLEGLYGNGKTQNFQIEQEFLSCKVFTDYIDDFLRNNMQNDKRHLEKIVEMLTHRQKSVDVPGIIYLLVHTRGELHHFVNNTNKLHGTPFNHEYFESIAWMTMSFAMYAIVHKIMEINTTIYSSKKDI